MSELLQTTLVGSFPQPDWLIDRRRLCQEQVPRIPVDDLWRVGGRFREQAQDEAVTLAVRDLEAAGLDSITDGQIRQESAYSRFAASLDGMDFRKLGTAPDADGVAHPAPRVIGEIRRPRPMLVRDVKYLKDITSLPVRVAVPGPFSLAHLVDDEYYPDRESLAMAFADVVAAEVNDLFAAGAQVIQLDEPCFEASPEQALRYGLNAVNRALRGAAGTAAVHVSLEQAPSAGGRPRRYAVLEQLAECVADQVSLEAARPQLDLAVLGALAEKTIVLGVIDTSDLRVEPAARVAARVRAALKFVPAERLMLAPDSGMKYLSRDVALGKIGSLVQGVGEIRVLRQLHFEEEQAA